MTRIEKGRDDLAAWKAAQPRNFYTDDPLLQSVVRRLLPEEERADMDERLVAFGAACAGPLDEAIEINNRPHNLPRLERYDGIGRRIESVEHHPSYHDAGAIIYGSGMMGDYASPGGFLRSLSLFMLSSECGEGGHNCPVACTAGVVQTVAELGDDALKARYLDRLYSADYAVRLDGAQFLTEVQGGSDVGANATRASKAEDGTWRIHGEKWFCSNADADLILMTARHDGDGLGTSGLGLFLVPRLLEDGEVNHFRIRRLKDKLGTRSMPSGEMDFDGAFAWCMGEVEDGFRNMMRFVIGVSRVYNGVAVSGIARRAWHVARTYAEHRKAFGRPIGGFALVQEDLTTLEALSSTITMASLDLAQWLDRSLGGTLNAEEIHFLRTAINLHKRRSSMTATACALKGIEVLGGNGAIETFSILPRLLRDSIVCENWEGTHNTLIAQVLRDLRRYAMHRPYFSVLQKRIDALTAPAAKRWCDRLSAELVHAQGRVDALLEVEDDQASLAMRTESDRLAWLYYGVVWAEHLEALSETEVADAERQLTAFWRVRWETP